MVGEPMPAFLEPCSDRTVGERGAGHAANRGYPLPGQDGRWRRRQALRAPAGVWS